MATTVLPLAAQHRSTAVLAARGDPQQPPAASDRHRWSITIICK